MNRFTFHLLPPVSYSRVVYWARFPFGRGLIKIGDDTKIGREKVTIAGYHDVPVNVAVQVWELGVKFVKLDDGS